MDLFSILKWVVIGIGVILFIGMFGYVKVPTDKIAVISGFYQRRVKGKVAFYLRWFERIDYVDLSVFSVDVNT